MEDSVDRDPVGYRFVENLEREPPHRRAAKIVHGYRIHFRVTLERARATFHAAEEILPQAWFTFFISRVGLRHVLFRLRREDNINHSANAPGA